MTKLFQSGGAPRLPSPRTSRCRKRGIIGLYPLKIAVILFVVGMVFAFWTYAETGLSPVAPNATTSTALPTTTIAPQSTPATGGSALQESSPATTVAPQPQQPPAVSHNVAIPASSVAPQSLAQSTGEGVVVPVPEQPEGVSAPQAAIAPQPVQRGPFSYAENDTCGGSEFHFSWVMLNDTIKEFRKSMKLDLATSVIARADGKREVRVSSPCPWVKVNSVSGGMLDDPPAAEKKKSFWSSKPMVGVYCVLGGIAVASMAK